MGNLLAIWLSQIAAGGASHAAVAHSRLAMEEASDKPDQSQLGIGAIFAAGGLYLVLAGLGAVPPPGEAHAPGPVIVAAGLAFMLAGCAVILQWAGGASTRTGKLPKAAPRWMGAMQHLLVLLILASLATIGSWIAFAPGIRRFGTNLPIVDAMGWGEFVGRALFGLGAIIVWLFVIAIARRIARQVIGR